MIVVGDELYYVSDAGIATCTDARTGQVHWSERLGGNMSASPVAAEGRIYFQNETGIGYVVKAAKTFNLLATNDLGEPTFASPAVTDGALYLRSERHVWKIGKR
jgi:outer membrane protein assembly factor BamB